MMLQRARACVCVCVCALYKRYLLELEPLYACMYVCTHACMYP